MGKDFYDIFGVLRNVIDKDIKKVYKKLVLIWYFDKNKSLGVEDKFKEILEVYDVFSDREKREVFDIYGEEGLKGVFGSDNGLNMNFGGLGFVKIFVFMSGNVKDMFVRVFGNDDEFVDIIGGLGGFSFFNDWKLFGVRIGGNDDFMFDFDGFVLWKKK